MHSPGKEAAIPFRETNIVTDLTPESDTVNYEYRICKIEFKARIKFLDDLHAYNKFSEFIKIDKRLISHLLKRIDYGHDEELIPKGSIYEITGYMALAKYSNQSWHIIQFHINERNCVHRAEAYWEKL